MKQKMFFLMMVATVLTVLSCRDDDDNSSDDIPVGFQDLTSDYIDLSRISAALVPDATLTLTDGVTLTGALSPKEKIKIQVADGATVTLSGVTIADKRDEYSPWAGITCLGNAHFILANGTTTTIKAFNINYPAILAAHNASGRGNEYTLTISGEGTLIADNSDCGGAAIGGGWGIPCGNISIKGGKITALGGSMAAAIGGGWLSTCGTIAISGGDITAKGADFGAGIGSGCSEYGNSSCGNITISGGIVNATGGNGSAGIGSSGKGYEATNTCGDIIISGGKVMANGGDGGAGIGSGHWSSCGAITITGGNMTATGGKKAAGIGCGEGNPDKLKSSCGDIRIENGKGFEHVIAYKGIGASRPIGMSGGENNNEIGNIRFGDIHINKDRYNYNIEEDGYCGSFHVTKTTTKLGNADESQYIDNTWTLSVE